MLLLRSSELDNVYSVLSKRRSLCVGTCMLRGVRACRIAMSERFLILRMTPFLRRTLLHGLIYSLIFNGGVSLDVPDVHSPCFIEFFARMNASEPQTFMRRPTLVSPQELIIIAHIIVNALNVTQLSKVPLIILQVLTICLV